MDIPINDAMLCFDSGLNGGTPRALVVEHPDERGASDGFNSTVGAPFAYWRKLDTKGQQLQLLVEAWHAAAFYAVPVDVLHRALLVIPEYRSTLADDCLPKQYRAEREAE